MDHAVGPNPGPALKVVSFAFAGALFVEFMIAILGTGLDALDKAGSSFQTDVKTFGSPAEMGRLLLTDYLLAFEVASFLLLVAAVGAVILARRREGLEPAGTVSVGDLFKPENSGTIEDHEVGSMLEAGGSPKR